MRVSLRFSLFCLAMAAFAIVICTACARAGSDDAVLYNKKPDTQIVPVPNIQFDEPGHDPGLKTGVLGRAGGCSRRTDAATVKEQHTQGARDPKRFYWNFLYVFFLFGQLFR